MLKRLFFLFLVLAANSNVFAQHKVIKDTINHKKSIADSTENKNAQFYHDLDTTEKKGVSKTLYKWVFRPQDSKSNRTGPSKPDFEPYKNKVIRHIIIESNDPFGISLTDSTKTPHSWFQKVGNSIHVKSKKMAVDKFLLFKEDETVDTLVINESARLLRDQNYIRKVRIEPKEIGADNDSIDIVVKVLDSWSLIPKGSISAKDFKFGLTDRNFIGTGHQLGFTYGKRYKDGQNAFQGIYSIPNIRNTFIDFSAKYDIDYDNYYNTYLSLSREFVSPLTKWAGGALVQMRSLRRPLMGDSLKFKDQSIRFFYQNYWGAYAINILKGDSKRDRTTKLILGARAYTLNYIVTPKSEFDDVEYYSNENFFLTNIGISSRQFVQDSYIFKDGSTEDVPIGAAFSITGGFKQKHQKSQWYFGLKATYGDYFNWGFSSINVEYGTFYRHSNPEQGVLSIKGNYFSNLMDLGKKGWKMRQFVKPHILIGLNRLNSMIDRVSLNESPYYKGVIGSDYIDYTNKQRFIDYKNGHLPGYESYAVGIRKYVLDLQTQFYSPWSFVGFHFNPFINLGLGYLSGSEETYKSDRLYSSVGIGVIIRNDYLVFDSFQLSFSYYPSIPGKGNNGLRGNSFRTGDYGFQDYKVGEPQPVIYE